MTTGHWGLRGVVVLKEILFLIFCASLCGSQSYEEICDFGIGKLNWLRKYLPYKKGIPSHDTLNRVLGLLNVKQLEKVLTGIANYKIELSTGCVVNIDGKWISRSATIKEQQTKKENGGKQAVNMVNVFCKEINSCLASVRVGSKSGEKNAVSEVLEILDLSNCLITMDAGYCYTDVADEIKAGGADYLIGLKGNQPKLFELTQELLEQEMSLEIHKDKESRGHGRKEVRSCRVLKISKIEHKLKDEEKGILARWNGLTSLIEITSNREVISTNTKSTEKRYYISSKDLKAKQANEIVRNHWAVENNLHWVLDVAFGEDDSTKRSGNSATNFSIIRTSLL